MLKYTLDICYKYAESYLEGVCVNSRHPGPRRVWKVGSGARLLPPLPLDWLDPADPADPVDPVDPVKNSERIVFVRRRGT